MRLATTLVLLLLAFPVLAQTPGDCDPGDAQADLSIADVRARLFNTGSLFFGNTTVAGDGYVVPQASGVSPIFAAGIWVAGLVDGELRAAAATYDDFEFWPGPLEEGATLPDGDCSDWDRFWLVDAFDVQRYEEIGEASAVLAEWPVELGAPVIDGDGVEGNYDLEAGDRPAVYGHQTAFWVMNDVGNEHRNTLTEPIGLEVRVTAFTSVEADLRQQTVYRYELVNRNTEPFEAARFGLFVDPDLGDASDDYVGSDSTRGMAFVYNGTETDDRYGTPPAAGYDFLSGAHTSSYFVSVGGCSPIGDPCDAESIYNRMQGVWNDGVPFTEGGDGYMTGGDTLAWIYPGDPVTEQFWSEVNVDGTGADNPPNDRRHVIASPAFTLQPGEARAFDVAILFAQGEGNLDSVAELYAVSDAVQFRYDNDALFAPGPQPPPSGTLAAPELLAPEDGITVLDADVELMWSAVPGAAQYRVEVASDPEFYDAQVLYTEGPGLLFTTGAENEVVTYHWRVKAIGFGLTSSVPSAARAFGYYDYAFDFLGGGDGIVETAYPNTDVCPDGEDPGCTDYGGNTVWLDPNATDDYLLASAFGGLRSLINDDVIGTDDFELRFTDACAAFGACLGAYVRADGEIVSVPFEVWNIGDEEDSGDDIRMIPMIRTNDNNPLTDWAGTFTGIRDFRLAGETVELGVTDRVFFMMPDRPNGYALFEAAANGFGGPGAIYDPETDGDDQVDLNAAGRTCARQGWYVDFCYRGVPPFRWPIGSTAGLVVADLAGDGTTPPAGTTVRFVTNDRLIPVGAEDDVPAAPQAFALEALYPNPFRTAATVAYRLDAAADVRLSVYDVLGRRVRVLHEGPAAAGAHRTAFDGAGLASGVYLVVLEAGGQREARKVMLVR
jgi:hypothetical protein